MQAPCCPPSLRAAPSGRGPQLSSPEGGPAKSPVPPAARSHPTPRAPALCPAAVGAALPASSAASRARARTHPRRAARWGCGSQRLSNRCGRREDACDSHACPAARPSASWRAGERAAPAAGGSAPPRLQRPARPASGLGEAARPPPPPQPRPVPVPAPRLGPELGAADLGVPPPCGPRRWAPAARRLSPVSASQRQPALLSRRARPAGEPGAFTLPAPRTRGARPQPLERVSGLPRLHAAACSRRQSAPQRRPQPLLELGTRATPGAWGNSAN